MAVRTLKYETKINRSLWIMYGGLGARINTNVYHLKAIGKVTLCEFRNMFTTTLWAGA